MVVQLRRIKVLKDPSPLLTNPQGGAISTSTPNRAANRSSGVSQQVAAQQRPETPHVMDYGDAVAPAPEVPGYEEEYATEAYGVEDSFAQPYADDDGTWVDESYDGYTGRGYDVGTNGDSGGAGLSMALGMLGNSGEDLRPGPPSYEEESARYGEANEPPAGFNDS